MLYCPNYNCQTANAETHRFCQKCRTPLPRRYLWAVGEAAMSYQPGDLLDDRYLCKSPQIFLNTKPGLVPVNAPPVPEAGVAYLHLSPYSLHIPQIYEVVFSGATPLLLLDQAAVQAASWVDGGEITVEPLSTLAEEWQSASALRQLNWLWQIAQLWQPLLGERVASSLLQPDLLRVEGGIVRLLELIPDQSTPTLAQLGQCWSQWLKTAKPEIHHPLTDLAQQLASEQITAVESLVGGLDGLLTQLGRSTSVQLHIATRTDQGPSRQRNEDACYPSAGTTVSLSSEQLTAPTASLVIVCDGIGGHQGGDVASRLAIDAVRQHMQSLPLTLDSIGLTQELEKAAYLANDAISQRNDSERRYDRQRMGTTLIIGLVWRHEIYITHVGDSRTYWITPWSCRQITQDDDVASREVRLGYSLYREALQQPGSGSLVQALGMGGSNQLHPTVQRFVLDDDSLFLLCSDGLSDNDRVEQYWESDLLPLLHQKTSVASASERLVAIANTTNGHDNVTVGLIHVQVAALQPLSQPLQLEAPSANPSTKRITTAILAPASHEPSQIPPQPIPTATPLEETVRAIPSTLKTRLVPTPPRQPSVLPLILAIGALLGVGAALLYVLLPLIGDRSAAPVGVIPPPSSPSASTSPAPAPIQTLVANSFWQIAASPNPTPSPLILLPQPPQARSPQPAPTAAETELTTGSVVYVATKQKIAQEFWVQLRVCSAPAPSTPTPSVVVPSSVTPPAIPDSGLEELPLSDAGGWIQETVVATRVRAATGLTPRQQQQCASPPANPPQISYLPLPSLGISTR